MPVNLMEHRSIAEVIGATRELGVQPRLVVFDTYARSLVGRDENSAKDVSVAVAHIDRLRRELGTGVLVVHHTVKTGKASDRGSGALTGAVDTKILLTGQVDNLLLTVEKQKNFEPSAPIALQLIPVGESLVVWERQGGFTSATASRTVDKMEEVRTVVLAALVAADERGDTPIKQGDLLVNVFGNNRRKTQALHAMADDPESPVVGEKKGQSTLYSLSAESDSIPPTP